MSVQSGERFHLAFHQYAVTSHDAMTAHTHIMYKSNSTKISLPPCRIARHVAADLRQHPTHSPPTPKSCLTYPYLAESRACQYPKATREISGDKTTSHMTVTCAQEFGELTSVHWLSQTCVAISTKSLTSLANVRARNPEPNLMLGMLANGTMASALPCTHTQNNRC